MRRELARLRELVGAFEAVLRMNDEEGSPAASGSVPSDVPAALTAVRKVGPRPVHVAKETAPAAPPNVRSDVGSWVSGLVEDPDGVLRMGEMRMTADLWTNAQLLALYDPAGRGRVTANGLGRELRRAGVPPFRDGAPMMVGGNLGRYYVVRHREQWATAGVEEARRHLEESEGPGSREAKY